MSSSDAIYASDRCLFLGHGEVTSVTQTWNLVLGSVAEIYSCTCDFVEACGLLPCDIYLIINQHKESELCFIC